MNLQLSFSHLQSFRYQIFDINFLPYQNVYQDQTLYAQELENSMKSFQLFVICLKGSKNTKECNYFCFMKYNYLSILLNLLVIFSYSKYSDPNMILLDLVLFLINYIHNLSLDKTFESSILHLKFQKFHNFISN